MKAIKGKLRSLEDREPRSNKWITGAPEEETRKKPFKQESSI